MVEGLEEEIRSFFVRNPTEKSYVLKGLSSYERLLAHAASAYNYLKSRSKNLTDKDSPDSQSLISSSFQALTALVGLGS